MYLPCSNPGVVGLVRENKSCRLREMVVIEKKTQQMSLTRPEMRQRSQSKVQEGWKKSSWRLIPSERKQETSAPLGLEEIDNR
ncbi:hypothetical protein CEXT_324801 [Caerostris extrusa]|uniref:Uncharacterized protein n=1 Tax=Caerostris extrusa TaxID=172846 RepID=A0AAV4WJ57_CAEEX|nr:hypothetical protein CEXT_324801 [Caerostris extrusa]